MKKQRLNHLFSLVGILMLVNLAFMPLQALGEEGKKITSITVSGNEAIQTVEIMAHITSQVGEVLDENKVQDDLQSIYKTGSFYDVSTQFKENKNGVDVNFAVIENPVVKEIVIEGNTKFTDEELRKLVRSKEGEMLNSVVLEQDLINLQKKYHDAGYVMAKVDNLGFAVDNKLTIQIFEGNIIEAITAVGNKKTRESVITRNFSKNIIDQPFNVKLVQRGMQNVYNTGFFEDVNMTLEDGSAPDRKKLVVNVKEGKTAVGTIGGGYSSDDGMTGIIQLTEKNFRGNGSQVGIRWEFGGANEYSLSYSNPWIDDKHTSFGISIYDEEHDKEKDIFNTEHDYEEKVKGISVVVGRPIGDFSRIS
ncbi:MAG: outer membrane protein assembly factor, partial [bacterium]